MNRGLKLAGRPPGSSNSRVRVAPRPGATDWERQAPCRDHDPDLWFSMDKDTMKVAANICGNCPVQRECRASSIIRGEDYGMWGGIDEEKRRAILKRMKSDQRLVGMLE